MDFDGFAASVPPKVATFAQQIVVSLPVAVRPLSVCLYFFIIECCNIDGIYQY